MIFWMLVGAIVWYVGRYFYRVSRDPIYEAVNQTVSSKTFWWGIVTIIGFLITAISSLIFAWKSLP